MSPLVSVDDFKTKIPGYDPKHAEQFHRQSARLADQELGRLLRNPSFSEVILLCGGAASGKTEFASQYLDLKRTIVYDGTLSNIEGAQIKLRNIQKAGKGARIIGVLPYDLYEAFFGFNHRERKVPSEQFFKTHSGSRKVLLFVARHYPSITIDLYRSRYVYEKQKLAFGKFVVKDHQDLITQLSKVQISEKVIKLTVMI